MKLRELLKDGGIRPILLPDPEAVIDGAYTSDLLSDVIAHAPEACVLITVQNHTNTVAVATLVGARAILVCHGREIPPEMQRAAGAEGVALLQTDLDQFHASLFIGAKLAAYAPP